MQLSITKKIEIMKTFTTLRTVFIITDYKTKEEVHILKVQKDGTKRIFFKPTFNEKRITNILFARLGEAKTVARAFLSRNACK